MLEAAKAATKGRGEWRISLDEIEEIFQFAKDGQQITEIEWRTLRYIGEHFPFTSPAKKYLEERLTAPHEPETLEKTIRRIVRDEFGFKTLGWQIDAYEARRQQLKPNNTSDFAQAMRLSLKAFIYGGTNQLSLEVLVRNRILGAETPEEHQKNIQVIALEAEFEAQRTQLGPDYPSFSSLLRQSLNTILHDYLTSGSVFNRIATFQSEEIRPEDFDDPREYRAAIKHLISQYLQNGKLEFLPQETLPATRKTGKRWRFSGSFPYF